MTSTGSVMSRVRMFEASGGDIDTSVDQTRKVHPFNRPIGNTPTSGASPRKFSPLSSDGWDSFNVKGTNAKVSTAWEGRTDSDDATGRNEPEQARIGFTSNQRLTEPKQSSTEPYWDQFLEEAENEKGSIDELDWPPTGAVPSPVVLTHNQSLEDESQETPAEPQLSSLNTSAWNQTSRSARLQTIRPRAPASLSGTNPELKRNLDAASVVMLEEKESSVGSRSSSSRSSLSNEELGTVAKQAWKLSKMQSQTRASRLQNSPLHQMLKEKRTRKYVVEKQSQAIPTDEASEMEETRSQNSNWEARSNPKSSDASSSNPKSSDASSSNSELRLSARLYRAEKYASIVRHNREPRHSGDETSMDTSGGHSQQIEKSSGSIHPVFGYSTNQTTATREKHQDDDGALSENYYSASGSRSASQGSAAISSKPEDATISTSSSSSRGKASRSERARHLKAVISQSKWKASTKNTSMGAITDDILIESMKIQAAGRDNDDHLQHQCNDITVPVLDSGLDDFESDPNTVLDTNLDHTRSDSPSDVENSVLDGEGILPISSGDESAMNWSITTGSASAATPFAQLNTSSNEGSAKVSSKASSGGSASQRLEPIPDDDARDPETSLFSYTESTQTSSAPTEDKSTTDTSSSKSAIKTDALRWWQKNYGKKMSGATNSVVHNAFSRLSPKSDPLQDTGFSKIEDGDDDDEEDDVFFGLEDDDRFPAKDPPEFDGEDREAFSSEEDGHIGIPAPAYENRDMGGDENDARPPAPPLPASYSPQAPLEPSKKQGVYGQSGMMVGEAHAGRSVTSDMTSSILAEKGKSPRYRPDVVETIKEESVEEDQNGLGVESAESTEEDEIVDEHEELDETMAESVTNTHVESANSQPPPPPPPLPMPGLVFLNIGCAIVDTFSNACQVPDPAEVREPVVQCATKAKDSCKIKADDCTHHTFRDDGTHTTFGKSYASTFQSTNYDASTFQSTKYDSGSASDPAASALTEGERRVWSEWDNRDQLSATQETASHHSGLTGLLTEDPPQRKEAHRNRREEARKKLLKHAERAMALLSSKKDGDAPQKPNSPVEVKKDLAVDTSVKEQTRRNPLATLASPNDQSMFSALSYNERSVLEKFSTTLRNEGIEVLKLNRRNKWQTRFLTVSHEVTWLNTQAAEAAIGQCPKALLWLKQFKGSSYGISNLKKQGRGGFLFAKLQSVETTATTSSSHIPKRLKALFEENACVSLEYSFEGGRRSLTLCFKNTQDAKTFCAAMKIIKDVIEREQEPVSAMQVVQSVVDRN